MAKTLVCIIEQEAILNYLFIREMYDSSDKVLLIAKTRDCYLAERFKALFPEITIDFIILEKDGHEHLWDTICRTVRSGVRVGEHYAVNLSGGTRLMSIAVQQVFERYDSQFYFMPVDDNVIIHSQIDDNNDNNDDEIIEIKHRVTVEEYLRINDIRCTAHSVSQSEDYSKHFLHLFTKNHFKTNEYAIMERLRNVNNKFVSYNEVEGLDEFVKLINFKAEHNWGLTRDEIQYLAGGWFEEYIFHCVKNIIAPDDLQTGVVIQRNANHNNDINELDVVFTLNNRLFVVECKTGVGKSSIYHDMVYKACALNESLLGLRSNAYIFSLNKDTDDRLKITARNMGVTFCDKNFALQPTKLKKLFLDFRILSSKD